MKVLWLRYKSMLARLLPENMRLHLLAPSIMLSPGPTNHDAHAFTCHLVMDAGGSPPTILEGSAERVRTT